MYALSTLTQKNQTTIPREVIDILRIKPSEKMVYTIENGKVVLGAKKGRLVDLIDYFAQKNHPRRKKPLSIKEMDQAIGEADVARFKRSISSTS